MADFTPVPGDALQDDLPIRTFTDPKVEAVYDSKKATAKFTAAEWAAEILGLIQGRVSSVDYGQEYACVSGNSVGDPVYLTGASSVDKADASSAAKAKVFAFIRWIDPLDDTICKLQHYAMITGLSGGTPGAAVYLSNAGDYSAGSGTEPRILGTFIDTSLAIVHADPLSSQLAFSSPAVRTFNAQNFF